MPILSIVKLRHLKAVNPIWFNGDLDGAGCQLVIQANVLIEKGPGWSIREPANFRMVGKPHLTLGEGFP